MGADTTTTCVSNSIESAGLPWVPLDRRRFVFADTPQIGIGRIVARKSKEGARFTSDVVPIIAIPMLILLEPPLVIATVVIVIPFADV